MFAAGVVPGLLIAAVMMVLAFFTSRRRKYGELHAFQGFRPLGRSTLSAVPAMTVPLVLLVGVVGGVFTPTEAGAVTVAYALLLGFAYLRTADGGKILEALRNTAKVTASVLLIIATAMVFNRILAYFRVPQTLLGFMLSLSKDPMVIGIVLIGFLLAIGTLHGRAVQHDHPRAAADAGVHFARRPRHASDPIWRVPDDGDPARTADPAAEPAAKRGGADRQGVDRAGVRSPSCRFSRCRSASCS